MARPRSRRGPKQIAAFSQLILASHNSGTSMITTNPVGASTTSSYHTATGRAPTESQPSAFHLSSLEIVKRRRIPPQNTTRVVESRGVQYGDVAIHRYECIICGKVLTRRHSVKQHFPACVRDNGNPNNYSWDDHPSCKLKPKRTDKAGKAKPKAKTTAAESSRQNSDQPPSIAEYSSINRNHMDSLVGMGLGCVTRSIDRGTIEWGSLGVALRNLAIACNDNATVARMDALVHEAAQGAGVEPAAEDDEEEEDSEEVEEDDDDEIMTI
ncbi:MAG: hypothetical protein M1836_006976 [Candelina mexicana]|nr:MAG: hypothetical protein M1836_006976 [Candelina mexicana]